MSRLGTSILIALFAGIVAVYLLPPSWLAPLSTCAAICVAIFAIIVRLETKTEPPAVPLAGVLLSILNLPEQPLAKVKDGRALRMFFVTSAFLVALGLSVMVRAYV